MNSSRTKVLVTIDWYAPGYRSGGPVQSVLNMVRALTNHCDFYIITRHNDYQSAARYAEVPANTWVQRSENEWVYYLSRGPQRAARMRSLLNQVDADVVYVNGIYSPLFSVWPLFFTARTRRKLVVAPRGMFAQSAIRIKALKKEMLLASMRKLGIYSRVIFHATSAAERDDIVRICGSGTAVVLAPNLPAKPRPLHSETPQYNQGLRLINIARISPEKNLLFILNALHAVKDIPVFLQIVGPVYDKDYHEKCLRAASKLPGNIVVEFLGGIEHEKLHSLLSQNHFLVLPSQGENYAHAVVEGWGAGLPALVSDQTPWSSLKEQHLGFDLELREQVWVKAFTDAYTLLASPDYIKWRKACHSFASGLATNQEIIDQLRLLLSPQRQTAEVK